MQSRHRKDNLLVRSLVFATRVLLNVVADRPHAVDHVGRRQVAHPDVREVSVRKAEYITGNQKVQEGLT